METKSCNKLNKTKQNINIWMIATLLLVILCFGIALTLLQNHYEQQFVQIGEFTIPEADLNALMDQIDDSKPYVVCSMEKEICLSARRG